MRKAVHHWGGAMVDEEKQCCLPTEITDNVPMSLHILIFAVFCQHYVVLKTVQTVQCTRGYWQKRNSLDRSD